MHDVYPLLKYTDFPEIYRKKLLSVYFRKICIFQKWVNIMHYRDLGDIIFILS